MLGFSKFLGGMAGIAALSLVLGTANELTGFWLWPHDGYPGLVEDEEGAWVSAPVVYGKFMWQYAAIGAACAAIGFVIWLFVGGPEELWGEDKT